MPKSKIDQKLEELTHEIAEMRKLLAKGTQDNLAAQAAAAVKRAAEEPKKIDTTYVLVLKDIQAHPGTVRKEIVDRVHLAPIKVTKIVTDLQSQGKLVKVGSRRTTRWLAAESLAAIKR